MEKKIKVLALCDSPTSATGFAQVSKNILTGLAKTGKYKIDVIGINFMGDAYNKDAFPYDIYPAMPQGYQDMYGRPRFISAISGNEVKFGLVPPWDIVFTIQDPFIVEGMGLQNNFPFGEQLKVAQQMWKRTVPAEGWFTWVGYFPVDSELKENWVTRSIFLPDYPVAYCEFGKAQIMKWERKDGVNLKFNLKATQDGTLKKAVMKIPALQDRIKVIHHGVDLNVFKPVTPDQRKEFRKKFFSDHVTDHTYLVINVSRNQPRKDLARTIAAFAEFKKRVPDSHLYLHCKVDDLGGSIDEIARTFNLVLGEDYSTPVDFNAGVGYTPDIVNRIYNAADLVITTTLGEGWGFITTEAMATRTPIVAPNITSILDIFNSYNYDGSLEQLEKSTSLRGIPVKAGSTSSEWVCLGLSDNERIRPLTNVDDLVDKMVWAKQNPEKVKAMTERAFDWVKTQSWENVVKQWDEIFTIAYSNLEKDRELTRKFDKTGRNDLCPCLSGKKFKHCHLPADGIAKFNDWLKGGEQK